MGYSRFMQQLAKGIEGKIVAYSKSVGQDGCLIYLKDVEQRIFVPAEVIDSKRDEAIQVLRQKIGQGVGDARTLVMRDDGHRLVFDEDIMLPRLA